MGHRVSVFLDASPIERQLSARLALACLKAAGGGTSYGGEKSVPIRSRVSAYLVSARLDTAKEGKRYVRESGAIAATLEVATPVDSVRGRRSREGERSDEREDNVKDRQADMATEGEVRNRHPKTKSSEVGEEWSQPANAEARLDGKADVDLAATLVGESEPPGEGRRGRAERGTAGCQRAPDAEDNEEMQWDSGGRAAYAMGLHHNYLKDEGTNFQGFFPAQAHQLMVEVYGDHLQNNDGMHLDKGVAYNAIWQQCWRILAAHTASWYTMPLGTVVRRFTACLKAKL